MTRTRIMAVLALVLGAAALLFVPAASSADHEAYPPNNNTKHPEQCSNEVEKHEEKGDKRDDKIAEEQAKGKDTGKKEADNAKHDAKEQEHIEKKCASQ